MPWGLQTLKNMINQLVLKRGVTNPTEMKSSVTETYYCVFYAVVASNKVLAILFGIDRVRQLLYIGQIN